MNKEEQIAFLKEIVETAYRLLIRKLAYGGITARNESAFQLELGYMLKTVGELYEFRLNDRFHMEFETYLHLVVDGLEERARIDLLLRYADEENETRAAIELKFFKGENHREPNNRYDVFKDLAYLEYYKQHGVDLCYFILATDHAHYVNQEVYSEQTSDFDFRHGRTYQAGTQLSYRTAKPHGPDLTLTQDYQFYWDFLNDLYFLKVNV